MLGLVVLLFMVFAAPEVSAQNTKGDQPARESNFKRGKSKKRISGRRLRPDRKFRATKANANYPVPNTARKTPKGQSDRVGKPLSPIIRNDPNNRRVKVYPQKGQFVNNSAQKPRSSQERMRSTARNAVKVKSQSGKYHKFYPQRGRFVRNPSQNPRRAQPIYSNRSQLAQLKKSQSRQGGSGGGGKTRRVGGRSASRAYISHKSINPFAGFWNKRKKGEKAWTGDISGRRLRTKNYQTPKEGVHPQPSPYYGKKRVGDRPYKGPFGGYKSATKGGRAWKGDITGRKIRGRNYASKKSSETVGTNAYSRTKKGHFGDRPYSGNAPGAGKKSRSGKVSTGPLPRRPPGIGARGISDYRGNIKGRKTFKPQGEEYSGNIRGRKTFRPQGEEFSGNIRGKKTFRPQGEEYSGNIRGKKTFRPQGEEYSGNIRGKKTFRPQGEEYSGNIRGRKTFRPQGEEYSGNIRGRKTFKPQGEEYSGNIRGRKTFRPQGEEYSGNIRGRKTFKPQGEEYTGNIKARKPLKGGGTVSGKLWNNKETPIPVKTPKREIGPYPGGWKRFELHPSMQNQGEEFTGMIKRKGSERAKKDEKDRKIGELRPKYHRFDIHPSMQNQGEEFTGFNRLSRFKRNYIRNPNAVKEALKAKREDPSTKKVDNIYGKIKQYNYIRNSSSDKEALDVREPGRAFGRANDYQGNIKMHKYELFGKKGYHPDAQFMKTNKNNVKEERGLLTNIKLLWAKLFRKQATQPDNIKEKYRKPRYDKGEKGLWYE